MSEVAGSQEYVQSENMNEAVNLTANSHSEVDPHDEFSKQ